MTTHKIQIHLIVITAPRKEVILALGNGRFQETKDWALHNGIPFV